MTRPRRTPFWPGIFVAYLAAFFLLAALSNYVTP